MSGYSGTPLAKKLGIRAGARLYVRAAPDNYCELIAPIPTGVRMVSRMSATTDLAHLFATRRAELDTALDFARRVMRDDAVIWVSWPKKSSSVPARSLKTSCASWRCRSVWSTSRCARSMKPGRL